MFLVCPSRLPSSGKYISVVVVMLKIEETMKRNGCFVVWPRSRSEKLILRCIINPTQPDAFVKLSSWSQRTPSLFQQQLDSIKLASEQILHEIWAQVCNDLLL